MGWGGVRGIFEFRLDGFGCRVRVVELARVVWGRTSLGLLRGWFSGRRRRRGCCWCCR